MDNFDVYSDIKARTNGEIYIGVVGPVRTGKSTFIKRFMELMVLPEMVDEHQKTQTRDELPQSAAGKTIMTTEPKFIPKEAAEIRLGDEIEAKVRLIDCVGFMVEGAAGHIENDEERLVKTPWFEYEIPFTKAAEIGTRKVINDHSTIGVVITTDGTIGELKRPNYIAAEERTITELKELGKPFIVLLNSVRPYSDETTALAKDMREKYGVTVMPVNCEQLKKDDVYHILERVLKEFPVTEMDFYIPKWLEILPASHWLKSQIIQAAKDMVKKVTHMKDITSDLAKMRAEYEKVNQAMSQVRLKGYGVVTPERSEIILDEPEVIKHGNKYGVKMRAEAPSINLIKAHIQTEIAPIVGSEQQAEDLIAYIKENARESEEGIWNTNIFGKSIEQIVEDGISAKVSQLTEDCQLKLQDTLQKIINDSNGGMICIII